MKSPRGLIAIRSAALTVAFALCISGCANHAPQAADQLSIVPRNAIAVVGVDLHHIRDSEIGKLLVQWRDKDSTREVAYRDLVNECGFDPLAQVESALLIFEDQSPTSIHSPMAIVIGDFRSRDKVARCIEVRARKEGSAAKKTQYAGYTIYLDPNQDDGAACQLDSNILVFGPLDQVKRSIDLAAHRAPKEQSAVSNLRLRSLIDKRDPRAVLWGVADLSQPKQTAAPRDQMSQIEEATGSIALVDGLHMTLAFKAKVPKDAAQLASEAKSKVEELKGHPQFALLGLTKLFEGIRISSQGATGQVTVHYTRDEVQTFMGRLRAVIDQHP